MLNSACLSCYNVLIHTHTQLLFIFCYVSFYVFNLDKTCSVTENSPNKRLCFNNYLCCTSTIMYLLWRPIWETSILLVWSLNLNKHKVLKEQNRPRRHHQNYFPQKGMHLLDLSQYKIWGSCLAWTGCFLIDVMTFSKGVLNLKLPYWFHSLFFFKKKKVHIFCSASMTTIPL